MKSGSFKISYELFVPTVINSFDPFWHAFLTVAHLHQMHGDGGFAHLSWIQAVYVLKKEEILMCVQTQR